MLINTLVRVGFSLKKLFTIINLSLFSLFTIVKIKMFTFVN
jgi:hypothetical protein